MRRLTLALLVVATVAGCSRDEAPPLPVACTDGPQAIGAALQAAPGEVRLEDGTALSECVERARSDADLQTLGLTLTRVAEDLKVDGDAVRLGYLIGAARRGAPGDSSVQLELVRRLERSGARLDESELAEGIRAGERTG
jgi:hypothetical protein